MSHLNIKEYSFSPVVHRTFCKIDYILEHKASPNIHKKPLKLQLAFHMSTMEAGLQYTGNRKPNTNAYTLDNSRLNKN